MAGNNGRERWERLSNTITGDVHVSSREDSVESKKMLCILSMKMLRIHAMRV